MRQFNTSKRVDYSSAPGANFGRAILSVKVRKDLLGPEEKELIKTELRRRLADGPLPTGMIICLANMFKRLPTTIAKFAAEVENE